MILRQSLVVMDVLNRHYSEINHSSKLRWLLVCHRIGRGYLKRGGLNYHYCWNSVDKGIESLVTVRKGLWLEFFAFIIIIIIITICVVAAYSGYPLLTKTIVFFRRQ